MSFALYRRPGGVIFLDDDRDYLEMLAEVMPLGWYVRLFLRPVACIDLMLREPPQWEADAWIQQEIIKRWREGASLIPQILQYWREDGSARFALTRVCVVDYSMPAMSGLRALSELTGWSGSRILLTGRADEQLAVSAFNRGLIDQFIPKQSPEIRLRLTDAIQSLRQLPDARHQQIWRATLTREQHALLCEPAIAQALENLSIRQGWIEHVVIGAPFGVLALDPKGGVSWLQLEPAEKLRELAEMAESQGWNASTVQDIRAGKRLLDLELQLALGSAQQAQPRQAFAMDDEPARLYASLFSVPDDLGPGFMKSHERFLATCGERQLQD
ncbi:MAG: response regulator receiver protein [Burkholderiales bacterium RIFCSPHIGHO2_12_FULL_61_11]|nr:MAG: response regulator receiver protein [Burkholderiales bacterium RIFCSPHIGHO2_12_FULL_61_11]